MKFFPIKVAIVCLLATPILYTITLISSEKYLTGRYSTQIQNILIGDSKPLLDGSLPLEEQIAKNIQRFLKQDRIVKMTGLDLNILVTTSQGKILYPVYSDVNSPIQELEGVDAQTIAKEKEIEELKSKIQTYERRKTPKIRRNEFDFILKRFSVIYKNIEINRKALAGFLNLDEDQQIKVEEIIYLLDSDPDKVIIKRKVFSGKKSRTTCFEVLFAYNGRLYFRKNENNRIEILTIGNKNTQTKDMEFIHNL